MKKTLSILIFAILAFSLTGLSTDLKWRAPVTLDPLKPKVGDTVTFKCRLKSGGGPSTNVMVVGKIDGKQVWSKTFPSLTTDQYEWVSFQWVATPGSHQIDFQIDPFKTSNDLKPNNNIKGIPFTVTGSAPPPPPPPTSKANLTIKNVSWNPNTFKNGDKVTFTYTVHNAGPDAVKESETIFKTNGSVIDSKMTGSIAAGGSKVLNTNWPADCSADVEIVADAANMVNETNEADNSWKRKMSCFSILPPGQVEVQKADLVITGVKISKEPTGPNQPVTVQFSVLNKGNAPSNPSTTRIKIGNIVLNNLPTPVIPAGAKISSQINWTSKCNQRMFIVADANLDVEEHDEGNNVWDHNFNCVVSINPALVPGNNPVSGVKMIKGVQVETIRPNLVFRGDVDREPAKHKIGDKITLTFRIRNNGPGFRNMIPSAMLKVDGKPVWKSTVGNKPLKAGEVSTSEKVSFMTECNKPGKVELIIDPDNLIPETEEKDNIWKYKFGGGCADLQVPWIVGKSHAPHTAMSFDERGQGGNVCSAIVYFRIYNKGTAGAEKPTYSFYIDGKVKIKNDWVPDIAPNGDWLVNLYGYAKHGSYIYVVADEPNKIKELNEANNTYMSKVNCNIK